HALETRTAARAVPHGTVEDEITHTTCELARDVGADAIVVPALSGRTARLVARHRPRSLIVVPAPSEVVQRQLALVWGLQPVPLLADLQPGEDRLEAAVRAAFTPKAGQARQLVVVLAGPPLGGRGRLPATPGGR